MTALTEHQLELVIKRISADEQIVDPNIEFKYSSIKGSGYIGIVNAIEVKGTNKKLDLIVKHAPFSEKLRKQAPIREAFIREIYFYDIMIPAFTKFQTERGVKNSFDSVAKCYATMEEDGHELLIFENLKSSGYEVYNRQIAMNAQHVEFVFNLYGKFHAISYAMKDQEKETYAELARNSDDLMKLFFVKGNMIKTLASVCNKMKIALESKVDKPILDAYVKFADNIPSVIMDYTIDEFAVLTHGDCWCNNMMFKYNEGDKTKPLGVKLIDFQIVREASPVCDLAYFFYACVSKDIMDDLDKYLKIYHNSLSKHLRELGSDPEKIFPYTELLNQWKKLACFGLGLAVLVIKMMLSDSDETPNLAEDVESGANISDSFDYTSVHEEEYQRRVMDVVLHCYERNFI